MFIDFLHANKDIFALKPSDMPGILREVAEHTLKIHSGFDEEKHRTICEEITKLLAAGFIKEVNTLDIVGVSDGEGLGDPGAKSFPLELAHPRCDIYGSRGHKRASFVRPCHLQVIEDHPDGST